VLRIVGDVRAGRRRELELDHHDGQGPDGPAAAAQQPDGDGRRAPGEAYTGFGEQNQRSVLRLWGEYMLGNDPMRSGANGRPAREVASR
jgi:hypothetical protein